MGFKIKFSGSLESQAAYLGGLLWGDITARFIRSTAASPVSLEWKIFSGTEPTYIVFAFKGRPAAGLRTILAFVDGYLSAVQAFGPPARSGYYLRRIPPAEKLRLFGYR